MKHTLIILIVCIFLIGLPLAAMQVDVPNEVKGYENLTITLTPTVAEGTVTEARFFFFQEGERSPKYSEFVEEKGVWQTTIPYTYLKGEELEYYTVIQNSDGAYFREPQIGNQKARLLQDTTPPKLHLVSPQSADLVKGKEQLVVLGIEDESALVNFNITMDGQPITRSGVYAQFLSFLITPPDRDEVVITIEMEDRYNNTITEQIAFAVNAEKAPFFAADGSFKTDVSLEYILGMGESANTTDFPTMFGDMNHSLELAYKAEASGIVKAGPVTVEGFIDLEDTVSVFDLPEAYPNTLVADLQDYLRLYNPIGYASMFDYTGEQARMFDNDNKVFVKLSLFGPALSYGFGDQVISFQKETINSFEFRGSSLGIDLPFFELQVAQGLSDSGLYQSAWPQSFFGFKIAGKARDLWYLQTNLAFISSLQGRYDTLKDGTASILESSTMYDLSGILPEQNMVFGLSSGSRNKYFTLDASFSLSLYNDNASSILDVDQLATDLKDQGGPDLSSYLGYLDKVQSIFPVLDFFLPTNGLISGIINRTLWGVTYGIDTEIPIVGTTAWIRKTDATYKSLGSSVTTDIFSMGFESEKEFGGFVFSLGYSRDQDNIADILFNDIIGLIKPDLKPDTTPTSENDISQIVHTAQGGIDFPQFPYFGTIGLDYTFQFETTNAAALAALTTDASVATEITTSTMNDITSTHTGELRWKSARYKIGDDLTINFGAKTKDSYVSTLQVDGVSDSTTFWEYYYALTGGATFKKYAISLGFDHGWSTEVDSPTVFGYDAKFGIKQVFFDAVTLTLSFDQAFRSSLEAYRITGSLGVDKRFGLLSTSAEFEMGYYNSMLDDADDALTSQLTIKGKFSR